MEILYKEMAWFVTMVGLALLAITKNAWIIVQETEFVWMGPVFAGMNTQEKIVLFWNV